jgi:hypothetical protein
MKTSARQAIKFPPDIESFLDTIAELYGTRQESCVRLIRATKVFEAWEDSHAKCPKCGKFIHLDSVVPKKTLIERFFISDHHVFDFPTENGPPHVEVCGGSRKEIDKQKKRRSSSQISRQEDAATILVYIHNLENTL